jgi:hypothetical protein
MEAIVAVHGISFTKQTWNPAARAPNVSLCDHRMGSQVLGRAALNRSHFSLERMNRGIVEESLQAVV